MDEHNKIIHSLWIGSELGIKEILTIKSFISFGHDFILWVYDEIKTPLPQNVEIRDASKIIPANRVFSYKNKNQFGHGKGSYAGFSDIFRYKLLYEYGGWWVDMDVTCLKAFTFNSVYVFRDHQSLPLIGNVIKCPKHSKLMKISYEKAILDINEENTDWHKSVDILIKNVFDLKLQENILSISNHDSWAITNQFITEDCHLIPNNWYCIHWQNEEWRTRGLFTKDIAKTSLLSKLLKKYDLL